MTEDTRDYRGGSAMMRRDWTRTLVWLGVLGLGVGFWAAVAWVIAA